jgi:molybdate transport system substrate-binding protein
VRAILLLLLVGCAGREPPRELLVFAAASLREPLEALAADFEAETGAAVRLNLAGSQELRVQLEHGARADVFASADLRHLDGLAAAGLVEPGRTFARNRPVIVVPRGNPAGVRTFADLGRAERVVVGAPEVPIGAYTARMLERAGIAPRVVSRELNVRQVLAKVVLGEADAGIVYRSDARSAGDKVETVAIPDEIVVIAEYPVAVARRARQPELARRFVDLLLSDEGRRRLAAAGFGP